MLNEWMKERWIQEMDETTLCSESASRKWRKQVARTQQCCKVVCTCPKETEITSDTGGEEAGVWGGHQGSCLSLHGQGPLT